MPNTQVVKVELIRSLDAIPESGLGRESQLHLFDRLDWFRRTLKYCPPDGASLIARAEQSGSTATLFLSRRSNGNATGLARWYTLQFRPVFSGADSRPKLLGALAERLRREVFSIALDHVPADTAAEIAEAFGRSRWFVVRTPNVAHWTEAVGGRDFAAYWADRPGQLRSTVKRKGAKAALDIVVVDRFDPAIWAEYEDVYGDSWKPGEGSIPFLRDMAEFEGAAGCLRMGIARSEGRAIAAQLWTVENGVAIIHKLAHREDSVALSPGTLLSRALFEHVIDKDRVSQIDFGTGDDRYKADWMTQRDLLERLELYSLSHPRGLIAAAKSRLRALAARWRNG